MATSTRPTSDQVRYSWDAVADGFDRHVTPLSMAFGEQVVSRLDLGPGTRVLDVATGSGALAIPAARLGAEVVAVDISPTMIERLGARGRADGLTTLRARVGDGEALDFDDDSFDVVVSMNGISVLGDLVGALREAVRVTRPGGEVVIVAFGALAKAEFIAFPMGALRAVAGDTIPEPPDPMPAFRLADPATFRRILTEAGLRDVEVDPMSWEMRFDSVDHLLDVLLSSNPIAGQLTGGLSDEQFVEARKVLDGMLRERSGGDPGAILSTELQIGRGAA